MKITIMDTTLRDGEQTSGVSFNDEEKLSMAKLLLEDLKVDRIEVASARVSEGEFAAVQKISDWANRHGYIDKIEVLGFVDDAVSINWLKKAGCKVLNLLTKGSLRHVTEQLRKTPEQHAADIQNVVLKAHQQGFRVNAYLEDWSNGMRHSPDYVFFMIDTLKNLPVERIMLPDTLGILNPVETYDFCKTIVDRYPKTAFDFHAHNDYDLAAANVFSAIRAGITCIHTTINGLGERAGNVPLSSVVAIVKDHFKYSIAVKESKITMVSKLVESFC